MKYILDTNICIYIINKKPDKVLRKFELYPVDEFGISSITHALSLDLTIISNNIKEFSRIPNLKSENWVSGS